MKWHCDKGSEPEYKKWLNGRLLIVGGSSVASAGQLTCELLANSLKLKRIGSWCGPGLAPVVGASDRPGELLAPCELYAERDKPVCILLLRSPLYHRLAGEFFSMVTDLAKDNDSSGVVIITGSIASEKHDVQTTPFRYVANALFTERKKLEELEWIDHEADSISKVIHGGGFARKLLDVCTVAGLPGLVLFKYCYEGDNIPDAADTVVYLNKWLEILSPADGDAAKMLIFPDSWVLAFVNRRPPMSIY